MSRAAILFCFLLSGGSGLIYEIVWTRLFAYTIGSSHQSMTIVVATFMAGLALGSLAGGRYADRSRNPLRLYALLVLAVGAYCLLIPTLIGWADPLFRWAYRLHDGEPLHPVYAGIKGALSVAILLPPTTLMGATLPALARAIAREMGQVGAWMGVLYAANTLGAVSGAWGAGFILIPFLGLWGSMVLAAAVDMAIGVLVLLQTIGGKAAPAARSPPPAAAAPPSLAEAEECSASRIRLVAWAFGISGLVNMMLQLAWTRTIILSLGNTTYAFSVIVGIFILGLSIGSTVAAVVADRLRSPQAALGWAIAGVSLCAGLAIPFLGVLPSEFGFQLARLDSRLSFPLFLALGSVRVFLLIFPATVFMGKTFPLATRIAANSIERIGRSVGGIYFANTLGSILGTLSVGFVLFPVFGNLWLPLHFAVGLGLLAAVGLLVLAPGRRLLYPVRLGLLAVLVACLGLFLYDRRPAGVFMDSARGRLDRYWNPVLLSMGPFRDYQVYRLGDQLPEMEEKLISMTERLYYRDGEEASVGVFHMKVEGMPGVEARTLRISGKADASVGPLTLDMPTQILAGHLPMLARPEAKRALTVGLGSGITLGSIAIYPGVDRATNVEISPEVVEAARDHFASANHGAVTHPKVRMIVGDGRNHLRHTRESYDVVSSEPSNFWIAGLGSLFTREYYGFVKARLEPGGVMCQWVQAASIRKEDFQTALRTFVKSFPHVSLWTPGSDTLFLGSMEPIQWRRDWIERCIADPEVGPDLARLGIDRPEALFRYLRFDDGTMRRLAGEGPENLDLDPILEYSAPFGLYDVGNQVPLLLVPAPLPSVSLLLHGFDAKAPEAIDDYRRRGVLLHRVMDSSQFDKDPDAGIVLLQKVAAEKDPWLVQSAGDYILRFAYSLEAQEQAIFLRRALLFMWHDSLRKAYKNFEGKAILYQALEKASGKALPEDWTTHLLLAQASFDHGKLAAAIAAIDEAEKRGGPAHRIGQLRGTAHGARGDLDAARKSFEAALVAAPVGQREEILYNLGYLSEKRRDYERAIEYQRMALSEGAAQGRGIAAVARCLRALGRSAEALAEVEKGIKSDEQANADALHQAGLALLELGDFPAAKEWLTRAAAADPERYQKELDALEKQLDAREGL